MPPTQLSLLVLLLFIGCNRAQVKSQSVPVSYDSLKNNIEQQRVVLAHQYLIASEGEKEKVVIQAREYIFKQLVDSVFPAWYGTPWTFEGTTTQPHTGSIACGYFVTTTLRDAGFNLPRVKWAQVASETMIEGITDKENIKHYISMDVSKVQDAVKSTGQGIYIAGLDNHVGFIVNNAGTLRFVHADYYDVFTGVKSVALDSYNPLNHSNYCVVGKILNDEMIVRWLKGEKLDG